MKCATGSSFWIGLTAIACIAMALLESPAHAQVTIVGTSLTGGLSFVDYGTVDRNFNSTGGFGTPLSFSGSNYGGNEYDGPWSVSGIASASITDSNPDSLLITGSGDTTYSGQIIAQDYAEMTGIVYFTVSSPCTAYVGASWTDDSIAGTAISGVLFGPIVDGVYSPVFDPETLALTYSIQNVPESLEPGVEYELWANYDARGPSDDPEGNANVTATLTVPEPGSLSVVTLACLLLGRRRKALGSTD